MSWLVFCSFGCFDVLQNVREDFRVYSFYETFLFFFLACLRDRFPFLFSTNTVVKVREKKNLIVYIETIQKLNEQITYKCHCQVIIVLLLPVRKRCLSLERVTIATGRR